MKRKLYIAYGSNMDIEQMALRCPSARFIGISEINGYELLFKGSKTGSYATIETKEDGKVPVVVWEITERDEKSLDRYEGFPTFYYKEDISVSIEGETNVAMVYIMDEKRTFGRPTYRYYKVIEEAYQKFGFDLTFLETALDVSIERGKTND
ncbi:gamma-glutamylcyclotransferase family protein [Oceanobacillus massiliensis]|uniref:gamma-glutamylcyclotransferase family protein n=1 Tax=Oceanobacillus massiliensis TaxID=1465765 RepID=UPI000287CC8D|nr:gamma-glutamylcyclotransferase family protein [Oceanobacillus massiliensis]